MSEFKRPDAPASIADCESVLAEPLPGSPVAAKPTPRRNTKHASRASEAPRNTVSWLTSGTETVLQSFPFTILLRMLQEARGLQAANMARAVEEEIVIRLRSAPRNIDAYLFDQIDQGKNRWPKDE